MKRAEVSSVASSPFSDWENVPDVVVPLILESLEPRECIQLSTASRSCRAIASRQDVWRQYLLSTWDMEDVVQALDAKLGSGQMCIPFKSLFAKTWLSTRSSKEPSRAYVRRLEGMFLMAELWDSKTGEILMNATLDLSDEDVMYSLCEPGGGIEIVVQVDKPYHLEGCTMSINVLDLVKGRTARLFHYKDLFFNKERDCDRDYDDDDEGIEVTWKAQQAELLGKRGTGRQEVYLVESECPPIEYLINNAFVATWMLHDDGVCDDVRIYWSMPIGYSDPDGYERVEDSFTQYIERMVEEHQHWY